MLYHLYKQKAVLHSLVWLIAYLILNTVADNYAGIAGIDPYIFSAVPNLLLAVICFIYLLRTNIRGEIGLLTKPTERPSTMLFYVPLLVLPFLNLLYGINNEISTAKLLALFAMFAGVGFMEEVIFRGLMFQALIKKWNRYVVVIFISLTFGIGHIVSMVAIDQSAADTVLQIINATIVGFLFMTVILASGNLTICIITHILYNFIASISLVSSTDTNIILISFFVTLLYFAYLLWKAKNVKAYFRGNEIRFNLKS